MEASYEKCLLLTGHVFCMFLPSGFAKQKKRTGRPFSKATTNKSLLTFIILQVFAVSGRSSTRIQFLRFPSWQRRHHGARNLRQHQIGEQIEWWRKGRTQDLTYSFKRDRGYFRCCRSLHTSKSIQDRLALYFIAFYIKPRYLLTY